MAGHIATAARRDWCTPREIVEAVHRAFGGPPDLDPCSNPNSIVAARREVVLPENGLEMSWTGTVYCNPPYGKGIEKWIRKAAESDAQTIMLIPASVSSHYWHDLVVERASMICFPRGRLTFLGADSSAPFAAALVGYHVDAVAFADAFDPVGWVVDLFFEGTVIRR